MGQPQQELTAEQKLQNVNQALASVFTFTNDLQAMFKGEQSAINMKVSTLTTFQQNYQKTLEHVMESYTNYSKIMDGLKGDDLSIDEIIEGAKLISMQKKEKAKKEKEKTTKKGK